VFRERDADGRIKGDCMALDDEAAPGEPLLVEVMRGGRRVSEPPGLVSAREYCRGRIAELPATLRDISEGDTAYPVRISDGVRALAETIDCAQLAAAR
jgi:nicotinate phosphoribosyltransferase